jgi:hypothetical protein
MITGGLGVNPILIPLNGAGGTVAIATTDTVPSVIVGNCQDFTIRLSNTGNMNWTSGNVQITGANAADFTASTFTSTSIGPDSMGAMTLRFCPTSVGTETATLTFPSAAPNANTQIVLTAQGLTAAAVAEGPGDEQLGITAVYPNPTSASVTISYYLPSQSDVTLRLVDETGGMRDLATGLTPAGQHELSVDTKPLPNGTYFLILEVSGKRMVKQLKVLH